MAESKQYDSINVNVSWHCANCGTIIRAVLNSQGKVKVTCPLCHCDQVYHKLSRTHRRIDSYAPKLEQYDY